jgi:hypothetical protein
MNQKKEFFSNNFSSFILENTPFFEKYKNKFVKFFSEYAKKSSKNILDFNEDEIEKLYESLFINPFFNKSNIDHQTILNPVYRLKDYHIDVTAFLNKLFLILANNYMKFIVKEKNSINKLKNLTALLEFYIKYVEYYNTSDEDDTLKLPKEIIKIAASKKPLNLFSIYKGIPIAHKTNILETDEKEGVIKVTANNYQIVAAKFHKEIFLLENDKEYSFRANIKHFIAHKKIMYLNNIEKVQRNAPKRSFIRVQPKEKIDVLLKNGNEKLKTELYDISLRGLCVLGKNSNFKVSDIVNIEFILNVDKPHLFITQGEIKSITKLDSKTFRYHIHFELNTHYEFILSKYITKREKEIVKELNAYISNEFIALRE